MFKGDSADMCAGKFPLVWMEGRADRQAFADRGARTPIGASRNLSILSLIKWEVCVAFLQMESCFYKSMGNK